MHGYSSGTGPTEDLSGAQVFKLGLGFEDREVEEMLTNLFSLRIRVTAPENLGQDRAGECDIVIRTGKFDEFGFLRRAGLPKEIDPHAAVNDDQ